MKLHFQATLLFFLFFTTNASYGAQAPEGPGQPVQIVFNDGTSKHYSVHLLKTTFNARAVQSLIMDNTLGFSQRSFDHLLYYCLHKILPFDINLLNEMYQLSLNLDLIYSGFTHKSLQIALKVILKAKLNSKEWSIDTEQLFDYKEFGIDLMCHYPECRYMYLREEDEQKKDEEYEYGDELSEDEAKRKFFYHMLYEHHMLLNLTESTEGRLVFTPRTQRPKAPYFMITNRDEDNVEFEFINDLPEIPEAILGGEE